MWANSLCWLLYGAVVTNDIMIIGPNLVGLFLASLQLLLFVIFGLPQSPEVVPEHLAQ